MGRVLVLTVAVACSVALSAERAQVDPSGRLEAVDIGGEYAEIKTSIQIPMGGWKQIHRQESMRDVTRTQDGSRRAWRGRWDLGGKRATLAQTLIEEGDSLRLEYVFTPEADLATNGVHLYVKAPAADFAGGTFELTGLSEKDDPRREKGRPAPTARGTLPREMASHRHVSYGRADGAILAGPGGRRLEVKLDQPAFFTIQDDRHYKGKDFTLMICFSPPQLPARQAQRLGLRLKMTGPVDRSPARLVVDPSKVRYKLDGFGGNYCFGIESPVTQYTLDTLHVAWARTEMTPGEWEPVNDNDSPADTNWPALAARDKEGSNLRREFLLARQIQRKGIPCVISIWHLPEWLYSDPGKGPRASGRTIAPDKWDELLECLGSYLVYARKQYGVEPDLFSFNEPDLGVRVKFSPAEHRDAIKRIGRHFASLGLRTKMLLGDVAQPRGTHTYCELACGEAEAMKYVGAVSFHSWGGASPQQYAAWGDLAERLKLPLLVAELGVDAGAWRSKSYDSYAYGLREAVLYQELIQHARMRGTMQWEFTSDYGIASEQGDQGGQGGVAPGPRYWIVKHFCNLTPPKADVLAATSDRERVLVSAFAGRDSAGKGVYSIHVVNNGAARAASLEGLPAAVGELRAVLTTEDKQFQEQTPLPVRGGRVTLNLAARSLLTLIGSR